jgi:hypothetical protein
MSNKIIELMQVPEEIRDINWLKQSLESAIKLELATLPPYLCAMWSIKGQSGAAYELIFNIAIEEMAHMGLVCNMLTTIGGAPQINKSIPTYPGPLPGGVRPELEVTLAGLSKDYVLNVCMQIEYPENGPVTFALGTIYTTIGAFYSAILTEFRKLSPADFTGQKQIRSGIGVFPILKLADAEKAISQIKEQGEGTSQSPLAVDFGGELAHYYKFGGIWHENTYVQQSDKSWKYTGPPAIPFPDVYPMSPIPKGGYVRPAQPVQQALDAFNAKFTQLLKNLQDAWDNGSQSSLGKAVNYMGELEALATAIMQFDIPDGSGGVYGPNFILVS